MVCEESDGCSARRIACTIGIPKPGQEHGGWRGGPQIPEDVVKNVGERIGTNIPHLLEFSLEHSIEGMTLLQCCDDSVASN